MRQTIARLLVAAAGSILLGCADNAVVKPSAKTNIRRYQPFNSNGLNPGIKIAKRLKGYCDDGSMRTDRPGAWRCFCESPHKLLVKDPCFADPTGKRKYLICPDWPTDRKVLEAELAGPLPADRRKTLAHSPWALQLSNGKNCISYAHVWYSVGSVDMRYECNGRLKCGALDTAHETWRVQCSKDLRHLRAIDVRTAWE